MISATIFDSVAPRALPSIADCIFYHTMDFADGSHVEGPWDIRGSFEEYIGHYPLRGKTMLDVGTASGFLTFSAEEAGAQVTALESRNGAEYCQLHFTGKPFHEDRATFDAANDVWLEVQKNGFWYGWHKNRSTSDVVYAPLVALPYWQKRFDVVLAGQFWSTCPIRSA